MSVAQPYVEARNRDHSLAEIAYFSGPNFLNTIELGWDVDPQAFGTHHPVLFTYINNNGYTGGEDGYNKDFVPVTGNHFTPGQILEAAEKPIEFGVKYEGGNWWLYVYDQWIGYIPGTFWRGEFTKSHEHQIYGEVVEPGHNYRNLAMGNGLFGESVGSVKMVSPEHFPTVNSAATETLAETNLKKASDESLYTFGRIPIGKNEWHYGGPGGQSISLVAYNGECAGVGNSAAVGQPLVLEPCVAELPSNEFAQAVFSDESFQLISRYSHLCSLAASVVGGNAVQEECGAPTTSPEERYKVSFVPGGGGRFFYIVNQKTGRCFNAHHAKVKESECTGSVSEEWERIEL